MILCKMVSPIVAPQRVRAVHGDCTTIAPRLHSVHGDTKAFALRLHGVFKAIAQRSRGVHGDFKAIPLRPHRVFTAIAASPFIHLFVRDRHAFQLTRGVSAETSSTIYLYIVATTFITLGIIVKLSLLNLPI
jgi:hypothetical protein